MCTAAFQQVAKTTSKGQPGQGNQKPKPIRSPQDVPLGTGLADSAKISILTQRERMEKALSNAGA